MNLTDEAVAAALDLAQGNRELATRSLRVQGYRFRDARFRHMADHLVEAGVEPGDEGPVIGGTIAAPDTRREQTDTKTFVFTCAQSNTRLHERFFTALMKYCEYNNAELHVSRFTYNKASYGKNSVKPGTKKASDADDLWYDPRIEPFTSDQPLQVAPGLVWCGELNMMPTRQYPLSSLKTYTRQESGIVPHVKVAVESIPTMKHAPAKFMYTTGTVTQRNYIQKIAGQVADFHHVYGALVVEVADDGTWYARHLNADENGDFYDLSQKYTSEEVTGPHRTEAITHGDLHGTKLDHSIFDAVFHTGGVVDSLNPKFQFFHDTVDFTARNHHNIRDPHFLHEMRVNGTDDVLGEFTKIAQLLRERAIRPNCEHVFVVSNHDKALELWLKNTSAAADPVNAGLWHRLNAWVYERRENGEKPYPFTYLMLRALGPISPSKLGGSTVHFVQEDESFKICGDIECGLHGHLGPNGARGNPKNLRTAGKANTGHTHSAGVVDGVYTAGVYGKLDMGYNKGLSSWSHSMVVTYPNGKRTILTIKKGRAWR